VFNLRTVNNLKLDAYAESLRNLYPLMKQWKDARQTIFNQQFEQEKDPENESLPNLSEQYREWKAKNYPGKKKRELTGATRKSHTVVASKNRVTERINAYVIRFKDEEPELIPDDWTDPTYTTLYALSEDYLAKLF
jgi:hypothetical protein